MKRGSSSGRYALKSSRSDTVVHTTCLESVTVCDATPKRQQSISDAVVFCRKMQCCEKGVEKQGLFCGGDVMPCHAASSLLL